MLPFMIPGFSSSNFSDDIAKKQEDALKKLQPMFGHREYLYYSILDLLNNQIEYDYLFIAKEILMKTSKLGVICQKIQDVIEDIGWTLGHNTCDLNSSYLKFAQATHYIYGEAIDYWEKFSKDFYNSLPDDVIFEIKFHHFSNAGAKVPYNLF